MIFGSFAGDVSLFALLEQFLPLSWMHCALAVALIALIGIAAMLVRTAMASSKPLHCTAVDRANASDAE